MSGDFELHGVRRPIEVEIDVQLHGQAPDVTIEIVGSAAVTLSDFDIEPPDVAGVLSVADQGQLELSLRLVRDDALCPGDGGSATGTTAQPGSTGTAP